jgi:cytochrome b involved in lipid metabolism
MKKIIIAIVLAIIIIAGVFLVKTNYTESSIENNQLTVGKNQVTVGSDSSGTTNPNKISLSQLAMHNNKSDCWVEYGGKVYDITSFLLNHPGSAAAILPYCGTGDEFTRAFIRQHGTSKVNLLMKVGTFIGDFEIIGNA